MGESGTIDTSIYKQAGNANPFEFQNRLLENQQKENEVQRQGIDNQSAQIDLISKQFGHARNLLSSLLTNPKMGSGDMTSEVQAAVAQGMNLGLYNNQQAVEAIKGFPQVTATKGSGDYNKQVMQQRQWAQGHLDTLLSATQKLEQYQPGTTIVPDQSQNNLLQIPPRAGFGVRNQGNVPLQYPPGQEYQEPGGKINTVGPSGPAGYRPPVNNPASQATGWKAQPPAQTGAPIPPNQAPQQPQPTVPPRSGPLTTKLPPGALAEQEASRNLYAKDLVDGKTYNERTNPLRMAIPLLEKLGPTGTGPGRETVNHIKSFAQTFGIPIPNADDLKDAAKAKKYLEQNITSIAPPGTNIPSVLAAFESNPNTQQPNGAATELAKNMLALARMNRASQLAFQKTGLPTDQYAKWANNWGRTQDVRGYQSELYTPQERKKMADTIKPGTVLADKIRNSVETAKDLELLGDVEGHEMRSPPPKQVKGIQVPQ